MQTVLTPHWPARHEGMQVNEFLEQNKLLLKLERAPHGQIVTSHAVNWFISISL